MTNIHNIKTPRGVVYAYTNRSGRVVTRLEWNTGFGKRMSGQFNRIQVYIDSEVLRFCSARVPIDTGFLEKTGTLGTVLGSGTVKYIARYSAAQYYNTAQSRPYDANRGGMWFERGKAAEKYHILSGAQRLNGGR